MPRGRGRPRKPRLGRIDAAIDAMAEFGFTQDKVKIVVKQLLEVYGGDDGWRFIEADVYMVLLDALLLDAEKDNAADGDNENDGNNVAEGDNDIGGNQSEDMSIDDEGAASRTYNTAIPTLDYLPSSDVLVTPSIVAEHEASCSEVVSSSPRIHNEAGESIVIPPVEAWIDIVQDHTSEQVVVESNKTKHENEDVPVAKTRSPQRNSEPVSPLLANLPPPPPRNCHAAPRRRPSYGWIDSDEEGEEDPRNFICLTPAREKVGKESMFLGAAEVKLKRKTRWDQEPWER